MDVRGRVIEVVSGMDLDRFIEERVTKPLGMTSTSFYVGDADRDRVAQGQLDPATGKRPPLNFDAAQKPKWLSGGGGMVSTASDYLRFCEMLLHAGTYGNARLLSPSTAGLMRSNARRPGIGYAAAALTRFGDIGPTPAMGQGFGLGFGSHGGGENPLPGSVGSYYWTGAFGTTFYVDPKQQMVIIMMIQVPGPANNFYRRAVRHLAYQALTSPN